MPRCQSFVAGMIFVALFYMKEKKLSEFLAYLKAMSKGAPAKDTSENMYNLKKKRMI